MARYAARKGLIYMATTGSAAAAPLAGAASWSLNRETDLIDVTAFLDTNKQYVQGLPDVKGDFEAFWDDTDTTLFTAAGSSAAVRLYLYPSQDALTKYAYGLAWISASIDAAVSDAVKIKGSFGAGGNWSQNF